MTSGERIRNAFEHRACDRIPFGELVLDERCVEAVLGRKSPVHNVALWLDGLACGQWEELVEQEVRDRIELALALGLDWISVDQNFARLGAPPVKQGDNEWEWQGQRIRYNPQTRIVSWGNVQPLDTAEYARDILRAAVPAEADDSTFEVIERINRRLKEKGLDMPLAMRNYTMGVQYYLELMASYPEAALAHFRMQTAHALLSGTGAIGHGVSVVGVGGHVGANNTSMISPEYYRRFVLPGIREQIAAFHRRGAKCLIATGGCVWPFIEDFLIHSGTDGYAGIDTYAGMDLVRLRDTFGDRVCLMGGVDSVRTLTHGTRHQIADETQRALELFDGRSGFILATSNSVHNDIPPENFIAMVDAYHRFYGLKRGSLS